MKIIKGSISNFTILIGSVALLLIILYGSLFYIGTNGGGYFCKYCLSPGIYRVKHNAERYLGHYPCKVANDSIHEIEFFWKDPRPKEKFIK